MNACLFKTGVSYTRYLRRTLRARRKIIRVPEIDRIKMHTPPAGSVVNLRFIAGAGSLPANLSRRV